jgi:choline-sulfatase
MSTRFGAATLSLLLAAPPAAAPHDPPSLVLITLDTTRADHVGRNVAGRPVTPHLDALAGGGTRFTHALTSSPLTLPAHCSLMTGLDPPAHGVRDNGTSALPSDLPTLASVLAARGYATAAFVSSRVLDRRFGLARGFGVYDDDAVAEEVGGQGYPERDAAAVTEAALAWAARAAPGRPFFLWIHYYDPHAPYEPPGFPANAPAAERYAGEVAFVDREAGRLLAALPRAAGRLVVAVAGDHGEMLGEHGEKEHGVFLYRAALEVPLILSGAGVPAGRSVDRAVGTRALASTLLTLLGFDAEARLFGRGLPIDASSDGVAAPVYSEASLPASAYGWSSLRAATDNRYRLVVAPRSELYDLSADPGESRNLFAARPETARRLRRAITEAERSTRPATPAPAAAELAESLRRLGYLSGTSPRAGGLDPKDGIAMLAEFDQARTWTRQGRNREAVAKLRDLVERSPGNVPFLSRLGEAEVAIGQTAAGLATFRQAIALNPELDFLHSHIAQLYAGAGRPTEARGEYEAALALNPRSAPAWLGLAEIASRQGPAGEELRILRRGEAAGANSAAIFARLAQIELPAGEVGAARRHAEEAVRLAPGFAAAWWVAGEVAEKEGRSPQALERFERALALGLEDPRALVKTGRLLIEAGRPDAARAHLRRAIIVGAGSPSAEDARRLLERPEQVSP